MRVEITFDAHEFDDLLKAWQEPAVKRTLQAGASSFGRAAKPIIRSEIPSARPGNKYAGSAGNLQRQVKYRRLKNGIGVVVGPMGRNAFYRRFVSAGTKAHIILPKSTGGRLAVLGGFATAVHHPGARPNDFIGRAERRAEDAGIAKAEETIFRGLDAQRVAETLDT